MNNNLESGLVNLQEKIGFYIGRLISYPVIPPEHVYFSLTSRCNLRCRMCDIFKYPSRPEDELSASKIKDIILQIKEMGIKHLIFSGGEPFLRKDFFEILEFAAANSIENIDIITNGLFLDDYAVQKLLKTRLNHITVSLDGLRETNDKIRGNGVFEKVEGNIDKLKYYKSKYGLSFPTLGINFTIMDCNIDEILPMVEFVKAKGLDAILLQPVLFSNMKMGEQRDSPLWPSERSILKLKEIIKEILRLKDKLEGLVICTDSELLKGVADYFKGKRTKFACYEAIKRMAITCDGKLWSCMGVYGDLKEKKLADIWFSEEAMRLRNNLRQCSRHCLQDCVYLTSDILADVSKYFKKIEFMMNGPGQEARERLFKRIDGFIDLLSAKSRQRNVDLSKLTNFREEISNSV